MRARAKSTHARNTQKVHLLTAPYFLQSTKKEVRRLGLEGQGNTNVAPKGPSQAGATQIKDAVAPAINDHLRYVTPVLGVRMAQRQVGTLCEHKGSLDCGIWHVWEKEQARNCHNLLFPPLLSRTMACLRHFLIGKGQSGHGHLDA